MRKVKGGYQVGFNTQPPEGGCFAKYSSLIFKLFQHTAARRRLDSNGFKKADSDGFNTQPPEGG